MSSITIDLLLVDESRCALDLDDLDPFAWLYHLVVHERAGRPLLAADPHPAAVDVDPFEDERLRADERSGSGSQQRRHVEMAPCERTEDRDRRDRRDDEPD